MQNTEEAETSRGGSLLSAKFCSNDQEVVHTLAAARKEGEEAVTRLCEGCQTQEWSLSAFSAH